MVIFLVGLVAMILMRTLRRYQGMGVVAHAHNTRDIVKFSEDYDQEADLDIEGESGWKQA